MHDPALSIRVVKSHETEAVVNIVEPIVRSAESYAIEPDLSRKQIQDWWFSSEHEIRVAVHRDRIVGSYYLKANQRGPGSHIANCGYVTIADFNRRGVGRAMCLDSMAVARSRGFRAMQFNLVLKSNEPALRLWSDMGFREVGEVPMAYRLPSGDFVDGVIFFRSLE